jgi:hypothetical protein
VFPPADGKGADGLVNLEGPTDLVCLCEAGGSQQELDAHFTEVFTPADFTGRDGVVRKMAGLPAARQKAAPAARSPWNVPPSSWYLPASPTGSSHHARIIAEMTTSCREGFPGRGARSLRDKPGIGAGPGRAS